MMHPSASCSVGIPYSAVPAPHELRMAPNMCDPSSMATSCSFPSGQTVDMGGVEAQVIGQWGAGFIVAVPADQPVPNSAWITPVHGPSEYTGVPLPMGVAAAGGAVSSTVYPNFTPQAQLQSTNPSMPIMHRGFYAVPQPPPPDPPDNRAIPSDAQVFVHKSDGGLRAMAAKGNGKGMRREQPQAPPAPPVPSQSVAGLEDSEGHAVKIFVHDSDGSLHHIAECSQGTGGFEVDMLNNIEEDWPEQKPAMEAMPLQRFGRNDGNSRGSEMRGLYGALVNAWNAESGSRENVPNKKSPSVASSTGSTTAESLPSPDQSGAESGQATPTPGEWSSPVLRESRLRALVASGAPLAAPPPPPCQHPQPELEQVSKSSQGSRKTGRTRGKVAVGNESNVRILQATEARFAPSPAPELPAPVHKAAVPRKPSRLARAVLTDVYRRISGEVPVPPARGRPPQSQKHEKSEKGSRATVSRRNAACREEQRRVAPEPEKRQQRAPKQPSFVKRAKQARNKYWSRMKRRVLDFLSEVKYRAAKAKKAVMVHGKTFILAASVAFLVMATILCFVGESNAVRARQQRSSSMHSYQSESPYDLHESTIGSRRVGAVQKRLDVESARALAAVRHQSSERPRRSSKRHSSRPRSKQASTYDTEAYAAWREAYLAREQEYFKGLKENDPELASLLEMAGNAGKYDYEDWTRMAATYDKVMTERYGDKDGINTEDALMADRIAILMQQHFQNADLYDEGA
mmetsp:Transcript_16738/g.27079  ORF Transcript_16738/g.27079 Transcript_16738/m.27079 type:complete len:743 (+) Transcript_16738:99-2327(+)